MLGFAGGPRARCESTRRVRFVCASTGQVCMMVLWVTIMVLELARAELERLDAEAARLSRGAATLRLALGRVLLELARRGGQHELGFSSIEGYVLERVERGATWARESLALAKKLEALTEVRAAVEGGRIGWSMAKVVAKVASPDDEVAWLLLAERSTVREMQALGRAQRAKSKGESGDESEKGRERFTTLSLTMNREELALFECARLVVKRVAGWESLHLVMEALVDEATSSLEVPAGQRCTPLLEETAGDAQRAWVAQRAQWREESEIRCEPRVREHVPVAPLAEPECVDFAGESFEAIDAKLRALAHELATRDVTIGRLLNRFYAADGWRRLGYATSAQYVRERLGSCETSIKEKRKLARRMESMPALAKAVGEGELGYEAALLVCGVATRETEKEWTERAKRRTLKMLREEVNAAGMLARWFDMPQLPPSEETMQMIEEMESRVLSGEAFEDGAAGAELWNPPAPARGQKSAGRVTLKIRVSADAARHYRWLEENYLRFRTTRQSFIGFLCTTMIETWKPALKQTTAWGEIFARDRYRCKNPVCGGTLLNPHHLKARGRGGSDDPSNMASPCLWCHIYGIHEGRLRALPPANNITWYIGRKPHTVVVGRERMRVG